MSGYPVVKEIPTDEFLVSIDLPMKKGYNYDVKYQLKTLADKTNPGTSAISVLVNSSSTTDQLHDLPNGKFSDSGFNESTLFGKNSFSSNLASYDTLIMSFSVISSQNVVKTEIHISLYQNPNRELSSMISFFNCSSSSRLINIYFRSCHCR